MTAGAAGYGIDRRALVDRHAVEVTGVVPEAPLSVGNGELCYTVDVTGLQSFPEHYPVADPAGDPARTGTLLATQAQWAWHSSPVAQEPDLSRTRRTYHTPRGPVPYVDMRGDLAGGDESAAAPDETWLRNNPHRLDLGRIGLAYAGRGDRLTPDTLTGARQRLDLWTGVIESRFRLAGQAVAVTTACHPEQDVLAVRLAGAPLAGGRLGVRLAFPYGCEAWSTGADWTRPEAHTSTVTAAPGGWTVLRELDGTAYTVWLRAPEASRLARSGPHELLVTTDRPELTLVVGFAAGAPGGRTPADLPDQAAVVTASRRHWPEFWQRGGAVDLSGSTDPRAAELERRTVLSQYLTAVHCAGSLPPQETGLLANSWRGRFHLEMHWWHGAHFPLWGRPELLERSLGWYLTALPAARSTAAEQGLPGARWPKQVGPDARESPSPIGPFLVWQQPHPIVLAELVYRATGRDETLHRYADLVFASADFMAGFPVPTPHGFQLGPPLVPAQESYAARRAELTNPTFELAYWQWGLRIARRWRERLGLAPAPRWAEVAAGMARPAVRDGRYQAVDVPPYLVRTDHPSMLLALGLVPPGPLVDPAVMRATLHDVLADWDWDSTWGWDYPAMAMTATWLGEGETAVRALLWPAAKNQHLVNGHNRQTAALPAYLPGNGGLLTAVALMARGGADERTGPAPGFPDDGRWRVRHEGLHAYPGQPPAGDH